MPGHIQSIIDQYEIFFTKQLPANPEICQSFIDRHFLTHESEDICEYFLNKMSAIKEAYYAAGKLDELFNCSVMEYSKAEIAFLDEEKNATFKKKPSEWLFTKATELKNAGHLNAALDVYKLEQAFDDQFLVEMHKDEESPASADGALSDTIALLQYDILFSQAKTTHQDITGLLQGYSCPMHILRPNRS